MIRLEDLGTAVCVVGMIVFALILGGAMFDLVGPR